MKHQTPESMKFRKLLRRLGCSRVVLVGTLELLWIAVQKNAPQGDIGRHTNEEIAIECDWEGDPNELVAALVETGWLDECDTHRLVVHDWEEHCPGWIKRQLKRHCKSMVTPSSLLTVTDDGLEATPNQTQPNLTIYRRALGDVVARGSGGIAYEDIAAGAAGFLRDIGVRGAARDNRLALVCVGLRHLGYFGKDDLKNTVRAVKEDRPTNAMAYAKTILRRKAEDRKWDLNRALTDATVADDLLSMPSIEQEVACHVQ